MVKSLDLTQVIKDDSQDLEFNNPREAFPLRIQPYQKFGFIGRKEDDLNKWFSPSKRV